MEPRPGQRALVFVLFILLFTAPLTSWAVKASGFLRATRLSAPVQGCDSASGVGAEFKTCAFYVVASIPTPTGTPTSNDAGMKPECNYEIAAPEIYFGVCNSSTTSIQSGFRFENVSIPIPTNQSILASYVEFTVDGPYGNLITTNIQGQVPVPTPAPFKGIFVSDISSRSIVQPTAVWKVESTTRIKNMGDPWNLGETRRTSDITPILSAIMSSGWQNNNPIAILFKSDVGNDNNGNPKSVAARRVISYERAFSEARPATRLVTRIGEIPKPSVSYYWLSVDCVSGVCVPKNSILDTKAITEAQRNKPVLVILDFGNPRAANGQMGTSTVTQSNYLPISNIENAAKTYIQTFANNTGINSKLWLGVGTNNAGDLMCVNNGYGTSHGTEWGLMMNRLQTWLDQQPYNDVIQDRIQISGASDIETWTGKKDSAKILKCGNQSLPRAPASEALAWVQAYSAGSDIRFINFGNYSDASEGLGINLWGADFTWEITWGIPEAWPLPEIYTLTGTLSENWQSLARYSAICTGCRPADPERGGDPNWMALKGRTMQFLGALTNQGEVSLTTPCSTTASSPSQGWLQLYRHLVVDIYTDNNFPLYSSDITYEDQDAGLAAAKTHETADTCATP